MRDWSEKLGAFLKFNEQDILQDKGKVSRESAIAFAEKEYEIFRVEQDKKYISDFDKVVKNIARGKGKKDKRGSV